ncbi:MAG: bifunctional 3,4-dihydroxy-2-butanone-4-phosphate synthase/GTP cyclohydrolase II [Candidatus Magasanikbacteria bacterium]|nr:bifunctional 3,4-dihydroxy-2-butanone-4-phosphate synthase/GTP cyclohydrolase II [Candidatus Magasanikbacteria bacterium]
MFNTVAEALAEIKRGQVVIVVDDEDRENEGDFVIAAEHATPEVINFMATHGRGLICAPLTAARCRELKLPLMAEEGGAPARTAFTVSVDARHSEVTTGISARDRALTIRQLLNPATKPEDLLRPGHIFPLIAKAGGVLRRAGHTEAAVDLARLAGLAPAGVICEIMNADGSMARRLELAALARQLNLKIISIQQLIQYRLQHETLIEKITTVKLPTQYGDFQLVSYRETPTQEIHLALVKGSWANNDPVLVRVHSSCVTGDTLGSLRCDCGPQLQRALNLIEEAGQGVLLYMRQEGRGIGLGSKLRAYALQDEGLDTAEANLTLGYRVDERDYGIGCQILRDLGISQLRLLTNNPTKWEGIKTYGLEIVERVPLEIAPNQHNIAYLKTKRDKLGHYLEHYLGA